MSCSKYTKLLYQESKLALDTFIGYFRFVICPLTISPSSSPTLSIFPCDLTDNQTYFCQITRRYAEFSGALVSLNETFPDERVNRQLARLQTEVQNFILRMAAEFPPRKEQLIFLINNYDMMLNVITVSKWKHVEH